MKFDAFGQIFRGEQRIARIYLGETFLWAEGDDSAPDAPTITLSAVPATPDPGATVTVTASLTNAAASAVEWSTTGPALSGSGLARSYVAGAPGSTAVVSATVATAVASASDSVTVSVAAPGLLTLDVEAAAPAPNAVSAETNREGTLHWIVNDQPLATISQIIEGAPAVATGSLDVMPGTVSVDLPELDPLPELWIHAVVAISGAAVTSESSAQIQTAGDPA